MVYRVLADGIDIFGSDTESSLLSPSLELELNSAGSLEFTLPPDHPSYDDISLMQTEIEVYEDDDLIFFGRPAEVGIDWNKQKKVVCEGALAYLNDAAIRPHKFEGALISDVFKYIIAQYNAQVAQNKQFIVGNITITDRYVYTEFDYDICLSVLISTCIDSTGGYLFLRKEDAGIYIDWLAEVPDVSDQPVQFASNMLDLNQDTRAEDICTVVLPVGGQVDGVNITIASVNQGSDILEDSDAIAKYGRILKIQQWNDIIDPQALKDKATEWLAKQQEDDITIETDAAELHYLDGSVGAYRIGQLVNVISGPHGVDKEYPILKMSMDLDSGTKKITLGTPPRKELTELSGITNSTGGSSSSGGGGGGGSSDGVRDVIVNGSSVVSDHVARISAVTAQQLADGLATKADEDDFEALQAAVAGKASQADLNALSTTVAGKASQADLNALSNTVSGKQDQLTPGTGISIDANNVISATGGGGTEVEANPSDPATDDLNTIKIGDTVYDIPGGGSTTNYGKFKCDVLFVNTNGALPGTSFALFATLSDSITNYDALFIETSLYYNDNFHQAKPLIIFKQDFNFANSDELQFVQDFSAGSPDYRLFIKLYDETHIYAYRTTSSGGGGSAMTIAKVYGLKFENKLINRSDIYSEEERMIGRWTDGKPLYQKTIVKDLTLSSSWQNYYDLTGIDLVDVEINKLMRSDEPIPLAFSNVGIGSWVKRDGYLKFCVQGSQASEGWVLKSATIQYTKTTDAPGSGFLPEDPMFISDPMIYSEEEQVVGSWTDGKPLYQKSGSITYTANTPDWTLVENLDNYDYLVSSYGTYYEINGTNKDYIPQYGGRTSEPRLCVRKDHKLYHYFNSHPGNNRTFVYDYTIQYTKTTDSILSGPKKGKIVQRSDIYSEEERLVGRWTDGKPLYQKTYITDNVTNNYQIDVSSLSIDKLIDKSGTYRRYRANNYLEQFDSIDWRTENSNLNNYGVTCKYDYGSNLLVFYISGYSDSVITTYITIQYTKTTDASFSKQLIEDPQFVMMSDIYSEDEQVVGRWTDGKPLYQKVVDCGYGPNSSVKEIDLTALNIDNCIQIGGYMCHNTTNFLPIPRVSDRYIADQLAFSYNNSTKMLNITCRDRDMTTMRIMAILKYTKSTDTPGTGPTKGNLIYLPALYSEEEREVGVWTDGRPLYQKTFYVNELANNSTKSIAHNISDIDIANMGEAKGVIKHTSGYAISIPKVSDNSTNFQIFFEITDTNIIIYSRNLDGRNFSGHITIQYTKTTDQPGSGTWTPEGQLAHHYSTSEKIVGTWIDGSTVYERTWDFGSDIAIQSQSWVDTIIKMSDYNIDFCTSVVSAINNDKNCIWDFISANTDRNASQYVRLLSTRSANCNVRYLTLQYTKTS